MNYSTYRRLWVVGWIVVSALFALTLALVSLGLSILFLFVMTVFGSFAYWLHFSLLDTRLRDYGGRYPAPAMNLGLWGVDIVDDRLPREERYRVRHTVCPNCQTLQETERGGRCRQCGALLPPVPREDPLPTSSDA